MASEYPNGDPRAEREQFRAWRLSLRMRRARSGAKVAPEPPPFVLPGPLRHHEPRPLRAWERTLHLRFPSFSR